ncbi:DUF1376 domain-containing protein [Mesorhizobium sp. M0030]|uniref:DUF1376 domain-containing protein n=1 Tax=Mesorhizobium sp. M0030 TaxID=2956851 RepID=UPI00333E1466
MPAAPKSSAGLVAGAAQLPYFRCFVGQWSDLVNRLDDRENALHLKLMLLMFQRGEPLPGQPDRLARQCHMRRQLFEATLQKLVDIGAIIRVPEGGIWSPIARDEFEFRQGISMTRSAAADKRWEKQNKNNAAPMQKDDKSTAYAMPIDEIEKEKREEERQDAVASSKWGEGEAVKRDFEAWWSLYPHKVGKAAALKAFPAARKKIGTEGLTNGLRQYIKTKPADRQWLNPATWLNDERWGDQPANIAAARRTTSSVLADLARNGYDGTSEWSRNGYGGIIEGEHSGAVAGLLSGPQS